MYDCVWSFRDRLRRPTLPKTRSLVQGGVSEAYDGFAKSVFAGMGKPSAVTLASDVAEAVWNAANDPTSPVRIAAGADAVAMAASV